MPASTPAKPAVSMHGRNAHLNRKSPFRRAFLVRKDIGAESLEALANRQNILYKGHVTPQIETNQTRPYMAGVDFYGYRHMPITRACVKNRFVSGQEFIPADAIPPAFWEPVL